MEKISSATGSVNHGNKLSLDARLERLWLTYYNDTLYAKGVITEHERNKMRILINMRTAAAEC